MPYIFRKIRQSRWLERDFDWLTDDEIPGDPIADFVTKNGALSVYIFEQFDKQIIKRIGAAIAATSSSLSNLDYAVIEIESLEQLDFTLLHESATTPDDFVNSLHYDVIELSGESIVKLAKLFWENNDLTPDRIPEKDILEQIIIGVSEGHMHKEKIKIKSKKLLERLA